MKEKAKYILSCRIRTWIFFHSMNYHLSEGLQHTKIADHQRVENKNSSISRIEVTNRTLSF